MNKYQQGKEAARDKAIEWQWAFGDHNYSMGELMDFNEMFSKLAKRYGLTREFRENGII